MKHQTKIKFSLHCMENVLLVTARR